MVLVLRWGGGGGGIGWGGWGKGRGEEEEEAVCRLRSLGACLIRVRMEAACRSATVYSSADRRESRLFNTSVKSFPLLFFLTPPPRLFYPPPLPFLSVSVLTPLFGSSAASSSPLFVCRPRAESDRLASGRRKILVFALGLKESQKADGRLKVDQGRCENEIPGGEGW